MKILFKNPAGRGFPISPYTIEIVRQTQRNPLPPAAATYNLDTVYLSSHCVGAR